MSDDEKQAAWGDTRARRVDIPWRISETGEPEEDWWSMPIGYTPSEIRDRIGKALDLAVELLERHERERGAAESYKTLLEWGDEDAMVIDDARSALEVWRGTR